MASRVTLLGLTALLAGIVSGQKPIGTEVHPKITTQRCTKDGCKDQTNYIVLDALSHPVHQSTNSFNCGDWGNKPNATACPTVEACAKNCVMEGIPDYSKFGVTTNGTALRLRHILDGRVVSPRVYLLDESENKYELMQLTGKEFTFDVDSTKLPCGMNSALYLSEMAVDGGKNALNPGGAYYGTGYCDAQCFVTPFINGLGNIEGKGACCNELDLAESNARAMHLAPHTCNQTGPYLCEGAECDDDGVCDKNGCAWNPYRVNITDYYGNSTAFKVDTQKPFTVITQFPADSNGKLKEIKRLYIQGSKLVDSYTVESSGLPSVSALNDEFCTATKSDRYIDLGATRGMGEALSRGMTLVFSIWWDEGGGMRWLDSGAAGPCNATEGFPDSIRQIQPSPEVTFSNIRWGDIGSTFEKHKPKCKKD